MTLQTLQTALFWKDKGISTLPVLEKSKLPEEDWKMLQYRLPTEEEIDRWFAKGNNNIGLVCGGKSRLVVLDFDNINSYYQWKAEMLKRDDIWSDVARNSYTVKTSRGMHVYIQTSSSERSRKIPSRSIDIRSTGNMVVIPPSIHPSGFRYTDLNDKNIITVGSTQEILPDVTKILSVEKSISQSEKGIFDFKQTSSISELKSMVSIWDFVSSYTYLRRTSCDGRWWMARCINPSHEDKHPSFRIDMLLNRATCLTGSCILHHSIGYDIIDLYSLIHGVDTKTAIQEITYKFVW